MDSRLGEVSVINWQERRRRRGMTGVVFAWLAALAALLGGVMLFIARADSVPWFAPRGLFAVAMIAPLICMIAEQPFRIVMRWFVT